MGYIQRSKLIAALHRVISNNPHRSTYRLAKHGMPTSFNQFQDWYDDEGGHFDVAENQLLDDYFTDGGGFSKIAEDEFYELKKKFDKLPNSFIIYRLIILKESEELDKKEIGIWWSLSAEAATEYGETCFTASEITDGVRVLLKGRIKKSDVNWYITIHNNMKHDENEIHLNKGASVEILDTKVNEKWTGDKFKTVATISTVLGSTEQTIQKIIECATKVFTAHGLDTPKGGFYRCRDTCGILADVFGRFGFDSKILVAEMSYPEKADWVAKKYRNKADGHYIFIVNNSVYDFTLRQFIPDAPFPAKFTVGDANFKQTYGSTRKPYQLGATHVLEFIDYAFKSAKNEQIANEITNMINSQ